MSPSNSSPTYELGLVMAGAVSAGAYTGGVIDFTVQALDEWYAAKDSGQAVPPHDVLIKVLAGASAGGMTAAMTSALARGRLERVGADSESESAVNSLYESWVERIDIEPLLGTRDLDREGPVASLLDSTVLEEIAEAAFDVPLRDTYRPYLSDPLHVYLSVANLAGVPYNIGFQGQGRRGHGLHLHADHLHFVVSESNFERPGARYLPGGDLEHGNWDLLKQGALATGAFPLGLAPRTLHRPPGDYGLRKWSVPLATPAERDGEFHCQEVRQVTPAWDPEPTGEYEFLCVDGGLMDNEPLELARQELAGERSERNPRDAGSARRGVILIDPFPNPAETDPHPPEKTGLLSVFTRMFGALKEQARFKPEELLLAGEETVFSRFMIAPSRIGADSQEVAFPLACGSVGAFGGFLAEDFRRHDFFLGRRNAQRFLQRWFAIPESAGNPLFRDWTDAMKEQYGTERNGERYLPIIPLVGKSREPVDLPEWPRYTSRQLEQLRERTLVRLDAVARALIDEHLDGWFVRRAARIVWKARRNGLVDDLMKQVTASLEERDLMNKPT